MTEIRYTDRDEGGYTESPFMKSYNRSEGDQEF